MITICAESLLCGFSMIAVSEPPYGLEPTHHCPACDVPLWQLGDRDEYAPCPFCGDEASPIRYCPSCDRPDCMNPGC